MPAQITNGKWTRNVPWHDGRVGRSDIFKTTLADPRLKEAEFIFDAGPRAVIPVEELRRVLVGGKDHYDGKIWGPFDIDTEEHTVNGESVQMNVVT